MSQEFLIARTKILIPKRRSEIVTRSRLLEMLTDLLDFKLIIVAAPAGYGKTSLLIDFVEHYNWPVAWLSLDTLDQDPARFISYFIAALQQRFAKFGKPSWEALRNMPPEELNLNYLVSILSNDIFENISEHFIVVLDDYHLLKENPVIDQFLSDLIQRADENCHLIINSRKLLTLPDLPLMVARSQVGGLSVEELAFVPEEIQKLYAQNLKKKISLEDAENLAQQSEGWITGLLLTSQVMKQGLGDRMKVERTSGVGLYEYLSEQVLEQQPQLLQKFLLRTSLLEEFNSEMCAQVIGNSLGVQENWERLMEMTLRNNVFALSVGEEQIWLRYHHLFQEFLRERIHRDNPQEAEKIEQSLAEYFISKQDWERSFTIYQKLNRMDDLAGLIEKVGSDFIAKGRMNKLSEWLSVLDEMSVKKHPPIQSLRASVAVNKGNPQDGLDYFDKLVGSLQSGDQAEMLADNLVRRSAARRLIGDYEGSLQDANQAIEICKKKENQVLILAEAMRAKGSTLFQQGKWKEALGFLGQSLKIYETNHRSQDIARIQVEIGAAADALGDYSRAERAYQSSLHYWHSVGDSMWQANLLNNLGVMQHSVGEFEVAFSNLEKALQYSNLNGNMRMEGYSLASIGDLYRDLEAYQEAESAYQKADQIAKLIKDSYLDFYLKLSLVRVQIDRGQLREAGQMLRTAMQMAKQDGSINEINKIHLEKGFLQVVQGDVLNAMEEIIPIIGYLESEGHLDDLARAYLILAVAAFGSEKIDQSRLYFEKVRSNMDKARLRVKILTCASELELKLYVVLEKGIIKEIPDLLVNELEGFKNRIHSYRRQIRKRATAVTFAQPKILIHAFGKTEVSVNNHRITKAEWKSQNARDLFFLFLSHPEGLTKEEAGLQFWPDLSQAELKLRFKNAIYRLRHAIGNDAIVFHDNYYSFNRALDYEYDVQNFSTNLERADSEKNINKKIEYLRSAILNYGGFFLADVHEEWPEVERHKFANQYLQALTELSRLLFALKRYDESREFTSILLKVDNCSEEAYRSLMQIQSVMGDAAEVRRIYQQCVDCLQKEMGIQPSAKTRQVFENLTVLKIEKIE